MKLRSLLAVMMALSSPALHATEIDPMKMPAVKSELAQKSLALGVAVIGDRLVVVGERGHILLSDNGGESWRQAEVPVSLTITSVQFVNDKLGWAGSHDGVVLHTIDGGETWSVQLDGDRINERFNAAAPLWLEESEAALGSANDDVLADLEERHEYLDYLVGEAEYAVEEGPARPVLDIWFASEKVGYAVGAFGMMMRTEDGGNSWKAWHNRVFNFDGFHYNAINKVGNSVYLAAEAGGLYRSNDDGVTWQQLDLPYDGSLFGIIGDGQRVIVFGLRGKVFSSDDQGDTWNEINSGFSGTLAGGITDSTGWYITGNGGVVLKSTDRGESWTQLRADGLPYNALAISQGKMILVGYGGVKTVALSSSM